MASTRGVGGATLSGSSTVYFRTPNGLQGMSVDQLLGLMGRATPSSAGGVDDRDELSSVQGSEIDDSEEEDSSDDGPDFPLFQSFPPEVRNLILKNELPSTRVISMIEAFHVQDADAFTLTESKCGSFILTIPDGAAHHEEFTALYHVSKEARALTDDHYKSLSLKVIHGVGNAASQGTISFSFDRVVDKFLFDAKNSRDLNVLSKSLDIAEMQNFVLSIGHKVVKNKKKLQSMLDTVLNLIPGLKNLEVVVGYNWHCPLYETEFKLIEVDEKFVTWVRDEQAWDEYGGLLELANIKNVLDYSEIVKSVWKRLVASHEGDRDDHACKQVKFKVSTAAWLLNGGSDEGMYQLRIQKYFENAAEDDPMDFWHTNIGYADEKTGEVEIPARIIFPKDYPDTDENGFLNHSPITRSDTGSSKEVNEVEEGVEEDAVDAEIVAFEGAVNSIGTSAVAVDDGNDSENEYSDDEF